jgi:hypothetical protein
MKAFFKSFKFIGASLVFLALAACGKSDDGNNVAAVQYQMNAYGQCYDVTHNTPVQSNLCYGVGSGQFQYVNNQCISTANNQVVDPTYCQQSMYGYGNTTGYYGGGYYGGTYPYGTGYASYWGSNYYPSTYGGGSYAGSQVCIGMYYMYNGYTAQLVSCNGVNCRGQFLYNSSTKTRVLCQ